MAGATITVTDANGLKATNTAGANGAYKIDISSMTAPFVITASLRTGGTTYTLTSMVSEKPAAGATGTANVTPMTNAIAALLAPNGNPEELTNSTVMKTSVTKSKVADAQAKLKAAVENVLTEAGLNPATFDFVTERFIADRKGADRMLEMVRVEVTGKGVSLANALTAEGTGIASVQLTASGTTPEKLSAPPVGAELGTLDHLSALFEACLADAPNVRVTAFETDGTTPSALSAACDSTAFAPTYLNSGNNGRQNYRSLLTASDLTGAKFSKPEILFTTSGGQVFYRIAYQTAAGVGGIITDTAQKTSPVGKAYKWETVGNQRVYDSTVEARIENYTQLNPATTVEEGAKSQYRVALRLFFNPINVAGKKVQLARVKGPGLPTEGVVMARSSRCGANDYMVIVNKTGSLVTSSNVPILSTGNGSNSFTLASELKTGSFDWSKVTAFSNWRGTAMTDAELAAIPSFAEYTWELWTFGSPLVYRNSATLTNATPPDVTYKQRIAAKLPAVGSLKAMPWNTLSATDYLNPKSALASPQTSATVSWVASAEPVDYAGAYGSKFTAPSGQTAASFVRISADTAGVRIKFTETEKTLTPGIETTGLDSLAGITGTTLTIPSCSEVKFPQFDETVGVKDGTSQYATYRDQFVRSRTFNLTRKYVVNSWSNFTN